MRISALLFLLVLAACAAPTPEVPKGFAQRTVAFKAWPKVLSPRGNLTLYVPTKYDTLLAWVDASDTPMGDKGKYRFTGANGCLLQESGFFKRPGSYCQDTLDRLTISTQMSMSAEETLATVARRIHHQNEVNRAKGTAATVWKSKKLEVLNGRTFSIVESFGGTTLIPEPYEQITAVTIFQASRQNWEVTLHFECKHKNCRDFAATAYTTLKSVTLDTAAISGK